MGQGLAHQHRAVFLAVIVLGHIGPAQSIGEFGLHVPDERGWRPAPLKSGRIRDRFDRRAGLAQAQGYVHLAVDLGIVEIGAAQHGQHLAAVRFDGHQRGVGSMAVLQLGDLGLGFLLGNGLQTRVEGCRHPQPAAIEDIGSILLLQQLLHPDDKVRGFHVELSRLEAQLLGLCRLSLCRADVPHLDHQIEDHGLASLGAFQVGVGIPIGRRLGQPGQQGRFGQRQFARLLAEIGIRRRLDAIGQIAIVDLVKIDLQDLALGVAPADFRGQDHFADLASQGLLRALLR